jgi:hypothetical protein
MILDVVPKLVAEVIRNVIPAQAGIQIRMFIFGYLDTGIRRYDG